MKLREEFIPRALGAVIAAYLGLNVLHAVEKKIYTKEHQHFKWLDPINETFFPKVPKASEEKPEAPKP